MLVGAGYLGVFNLVPLEGVPLGSGVSHVESLRVQYLGPDRLKFEEFEFLI